MLYWDSWHLQLRSRRVRAFTIALENGKKRRFSKEELGERCKDIHVLEFSRPVAIPVNECFIAYIRRHDLTGKGTFDLRNARQNPAHLPQVVEALKLKLRVIA